jgi:hypothetical protein
MPIDERRLLDLRRYENAEAGVSERFLDERLGPSRAFAILTEPLGERLGQGWVIVPSIGPEHGNLRRLETLVAHALAASGFPVLRIRPDLHPVHGAIGEIDLTTRIAEVDDAMQVLAAEANAESVGLLGAIFGGAVAGLAAERTQATSLVLVEPVTRGRQYLREIMRRQAVADVVSGSDNGGPAPPVESAADELARTGVTTIRGLVLTKEQHDAVSAVSLEGSLTSFAGRSLVVGFSPTGAPSPRLQKLFDRLAELGGDAQLDVVAVDLAAPFGEYYYRNAGPVRIDTRLELDDRVASAVADWASGSRRRPGEVEA